MSVATREHAAATIAAAGAGPVTAANSTVNQPEANKKARFVAGTALASLLSDELQKQAGVLKYYIESLVRLDADGREGFKSAINSILKQRQALVKENGTSLYKAVNTSASVRLSEFNKLAQAIDKGFKPDMSQSYHTIVAMAREFVGKDGRGRKATAGIIKAMKFLEKVEAMDDEDKEAIKAALAAVAEIAVSRGYAAE